MEERLGISTGEQDIRFNLMAVVPDRRIAITHKLNILRTNKNIVTSALEKLTTANNPQPSCTIDVKKESIDDSNKKETSDDAIKKESIDDAIKRESSNDAIKKEPNDTSNINILQRLSLHGEVF